MGMKIVKEVSQDMTIKQLTDLLQKRIDGRLKCFTEYYDRMRAINNEVEELEKKMYVVITELEPVQSLIYNQNPSLEKIFESLKRVYGSTEDGTNNETN